MSNFASCSSGILFSLLLALGSAACASTPRVADGPALEAGVPGIERLAARRVEGAWRVEGTARCEWPATPAREDFVVVALAADGRELARTPVAAVAHAGTQRHKRDVLLSLEADVPAPVDAALLRLTRP